VNYEVLDSGNDSAKWKKLLNLLPENIQDIYFYPEYVGMHKFIEGTKSLLFTYREKQKIWVHPFLLQPINTEVFSLSSGPWFDIETAYGYGGPLANTEDKFFLDKANELFSEWCIENNVIAEFVRFHPILNNQYWVSQNTKVEYDRNTVVLNLKDFDKDDPPFCGKIRNMIKRVDKANVTIDVYDPVKNFSHFENLYLATMSRISADSYYYFNEIYFSDLSRFISENGWLLGATLENEWVGAAIFLKGKRTLHYHLSATDQDNRIPGITNALIFKSIELGVRNGLKTMHLGGGNSDAPDDSLLKFKKKMGDNLLKFHIGKRIHNLEIYKILCEKWSMNNPESVDKYKNRLLCYRHNNNMN